MKPGPNHNSPPMGSMKYFDLQKNWRLVRKHVQDPHIQQVLVRDLNKYTWGLWKQKFTLGMKPSDVESCDWEVSKQKPGRHPAFWAYVKHAACHWLCNFNLEIAQAVRPLESWRIITSEKHSTVWNGKSLLLDFNFQALEISPKECFELAYDDELLPGRHRLCGFASRWSRPLDRILPM